MKHVEEVDKWDCSVTCVEEFQIIPMERPFFYIKDLQASFEYSKLEFSEEYYELVPDIQVKLI